MSNGWLVAVPHDNVPRYFTPERVRIQVALCRPSLVGRALEQKALMVEHTLFLFLNPTCYKDKEDLVDQGHLARYRQANNIPDDISLLMDIAVSDLRYEDLLILCIEASIPPEATSVTIQPASGNEN